MGHDVSKAALAREPDGVGMDRFRCAEWLRRLKPIRVRQIVGSQGPGASSRAPLRGRTRSRRSECSRWGDFGAVQHMIEQKEYVYRTWNEKCRSVKWHGTELLGRKSGAHREPCGNDPVLSLFLAA